MRSIKNAEIMQIPYSEIMRNLIVNQSLTSISEMMHC